MMKQPWVRSVGIITLVGVLVPSVGLIFMADSAGAVLPTRSGSIVTQHWSGVLPEDQRVTVLATFGDEVVRGNETGLVWEPLPMR